MRIQRHTAVHCITLALAAFISSCTVKSCYDDINPVMTVRLLASGTGLEVKAETIKVLGVSHADTLKLVDTKSASFFSLPLDPGNDSSLFYMTLNGITDTALVFYTRHPHLVAPECGYTILSEITGLRTTHNVIDTLIIENKSVNLNGQRNLHLFY